MISCHLFALLYLLKLISAAPQVTINSNQAITGSDEGNGIESFKAVPYAQPPYGALRFARPLAFNGSYDGLQATEFSNSCIGQDSSDITNIFAKVASPLNPTVRQIVPIINSIFNVSSTTTDENCLFLNVFRPSGTTPDSGLPVMVWIHGDTYSRGSAAKYDGAHYVIASKRINQPVILVTFNYRLGPFGFLGGDAIKAENNGNAGLLDQRLAFEWVQDHITDFGGDAKRVTIFGEGAGAGSIINHLVALDGDITYRNSPLFRAAILQSPTALSLESVTDATPQEAFQKVAEVVGCGKRLSSSEMLYCLRHTSQWQISRAQYSVDQSATGTVWLPRADDSYLRDRPKKLLASGKVAAIPFIIGNQEDEGTRFAYWYNTIVKTDSDFENFVGDLVYSINSEEKTTLAKLYPSDPTVGAPFRTGTSNQVTPQFKRVAAFLTDFRYQSVRRQLLQQTENAGVARYNFASTQLHDLIPTLGSFSGNDIIWQWYQDSGPYKAYQDYYIAFANHLNPNIGVSLLSWPKYTQENKETLGIEFNSLNITRDDFREEQIEFLINSPDPSSLD